ncbi:MAG: PilW family protein [Pseudomonas sp.]
MSSMFKKNSVHRFQRGISLIELMVAMTIGSFLVLGITQIFITSQKNYLFQQSQLGNQENGRFALVVLGQELSKAGYRSKPTTLFAASSAVVSGCNFPEGASVVALSTTSLCIQYQASNRAEITCQGAALSGADQATIVSPYGQINPLIVEKIEFDKNTNSITCTTGGATQQLVTGVADIRFDYGSGDNKTVTAFGSSPTLTVGAVRYAALMQSGNSTIRDTTTVPKVLSDWKNRFGGTVSDNTKIYQIVQSTIMLRNQMQ